MHYLNCRQNQVKKLKDTQTRTFINYTQNCRNQKHQLEGTCKSTQTSPLVSYVERPRSKGGLHCWRQNWRQTWSQSLREHLHSTCEALDSNPNTETTTTKQNKSKNKETLILCRSSNLYILKFSSSNWPLEASVTNSVPYPFSRGHQSF